MNFSITNNLERSQPQLEAALFCNSLAKSAPKCTKMPHYFIFWLKMKPLVTLNVSLHSQVCSWVTEPTVVNKAKQLWNLQRKLILILMWSERSEGFHLSTLVCDTNSLNHSWYWQHCYLQGWVQRTATKKTKRSIRKLQT